MTSGVVVERDAGAVHGDFPYFSRDSPTLIAEVGLFNEAEMTKKVALVLRVNEVSARTA